VSAPARLDQARYPRLAAYLASLPAGIASYPEAEARASLLTTAFESRRPILDAGGLPPEVLSLFRRPPLPSAWITQVHFRAAMLALADMHFGSDEAYVDWIHELNRRLYDKPFMKVIRALVSQGRVVSTFCSRWSSFHRGVTCRCDALSGKMAIVSLTYPAHLLNRIQGRTFAISLLAALEIVERRAASAVLTEHTPERCVVAASWR
jgi:hypothetical protein